MRGKGKKRRISIDYRARRFAREKVDIAYMQEIGFWGYEQTWVRRRGMRLSHWYGQVKRRVSTMTSLLNHVNRNKDRLWLSVIDTWYLLCCYRFWQSCSPYSIYEDLGFEFLQPFSGNLFRRGTTYWVCPWCTNVLRKRIPEVRLGWLTYSFRIDPVQRDTSTALG